MKKYIALIALTINFFQLTNCMEASYMEDESSNNQQPINNIHQPIDIANAKCHIATIVENNEGLEEIFAELANFFDRPEFGHANNIPVRIELTQFVRKLIKENYKRDKKTEKVLTSELTTVIKHSLTRPLNEKKVDEILHLIISGANPDVMVSMDINDEIVPVSLLNFCIYYAYKFKKSNYNPYPAIIQCLLLYAANTNPLCNIEPEPDNSHTDTHRALFYPPLIPAAWMAPLQIVRQLVVFGADLKNHPCLLTPLQGRLDEKTLNFFFGYGFKMTSQTSNGLLMVYRPTLEVLELLVKYGFDVNFKDKDDKTLLKCATQGRNLEIIEYILQILVKDLLPKAAIPAYQTALLLAQFTGDDSALALFNKYNHKKAETDEKVEIDVEKESDKQNKTSFMDTDFSQEKDQNDYHMSEKEDNEIIEQVNQIYQQSEVNSADSDSDPRTSDESSISRLTAKEESELINLACSLSIKSDSDHPQEVESRCENMRKFMQLLLKAKPKANL